MKEAQRTNSLSPQDRQTEEGLTLDDRLCLKKGLTDERRVKISPKECTETETRPKWSKLDEVFWTEIYSYMNLGTETWLWRVFVVYLYVVFLSYACAAGKH